jgi:hypothetical protein
MAAGARSIRKSMTICRSGSSPAARRLCAATRRRAGVRSDPIVAIDTSYRL